MTENIIATTGGDAADKSATMKSFKLEFTGGQETVSISRGEEEEEDNVDGDSTCVSEAVKIDLEICDDSDQATAL